MVPPWATRGQTGTTMWWAGGRGVHRPLLGHLQPVMTPLFLPLLLRGPHLPGTAVHNARAQRGHLHLPLGPTDGAVWW